MRFHAFVKETVMSKPLLAPLFVLIIITAFVTGPVFAGTPDPRTKIGPYLQKTLFHSENRISDNAGNPLMTVIVVMYNDDGNESMPEALVTELEERVQALDGNVGDCVYDRCRAELPRDAVVKIADWEKVRAVKTPTLIRVPGPSHDAATRGKRSGEVVSEGVSLIGADAWHNKGFTGKNVRVGILDGGFLGVDYLVGTEIPDSTLYSVVGDDSDFYQTDHGTACAEIVHDTAPDATMYLINGLDLDVGYHIAVNRLINAGVDIISSSIGSNNLIYSVYLYVLLETVKADDLLSMQYVLDQIIIFEDMLYRVKISTKKAADAGIFWAQAAGNSGRQLWGGAFQDVDGDGIHNFTADRELNELIPFKANVSESPVFLSLFWLDAESTDYDLLILDENNNVVISSTVDQKTIPVSIEAVAFYLEPGKRYFAEVKKTRGADAPFYMILGVDDLVGFEFGVKAGTINFCYPAQMSEVFTLGAVSHNNPTSVEEYSSQGPSETGDVKPDAAGPDGVSTASFADPFYGTSATAPHAAGAAALIKQKHPEYTPQDIKNFFAHYALDLGVSGNDNAYGWGLLQLPQPEEFCFQPTLSSENLIQWDCRGKDTFYCIDIFDAGWNMLYQAAACGEGLHTFSPESLNLISGTYRWKVWSPSVFDYFADLGRFQGEFTVSNGVSDPACAGLPYHSSYQEITWGCRNSDTFYCIDIFDAGWNTLYQAASCGEGLHRFAPETLGLFAGEYHWKVWSPSAPDFWSNLGPFEGGFTVADSGVCAGLPYSSTYESAAWGCRGNDTFYCIDIFDGNWNMLYQAASCGEGLHDFSPASLNLYPGLYRWKAWSASVFDYFADLGLMQGEFTVK